MKDMVEIEVILDEHYVDPRVTIRTRANTPQVENIIIAIENVSNSDYPQIAAMKDSSLVFISQRDIVRVYTHGRSVVLQTENDEYILKGSLSGIEDALNRTRFLRISQSEIINIYKVRHFDFNLTGTIGVEFDCGIKTWASRRRIRDIKELLIENSITRV